MNDLKEALDDGLAEWLDARREYEKQRDYQDKHYNWRLDLTRERKRVDAAVHKIAEAIVVYVGEAVERRLESLRSEP